MIGDDVPKVLQCMRASLAIIAGQDGLAGRAHCSCLKATCVGPPSRTPQPLLLLACLHAPLQVKQVWGFSTTDVLHQEAFAFKHVALAEWCIICM